MKETFVNKKFGGDAIKMIETINSILVSYERQGYDLSLRQLYYQLVSKNIVPNTERSYKNIGTLVSDARLAGMVDWNMIKDRGRETLEPPNWRGLSHFLESVAPQFRVDMWENQYAYVEVMVEKQALEGVLEPICRELRVPFTANKGYSSSSAVYEASRRFLERRESGKECHVIYLGDHDPSGIDMSRDVEERLDLFVKTSMGEEHLIGPGEEPSVVMHRIALNMSQVREFNPPENPAKLTDSRAAGYIREFGRSSWELDAIEPRRLASLVREAIESVTDDEQWVIDQERERGIRGTLRRIAAQHSSDE